MRRFFARVLLGSYLVSGGSMAIAAEVPDGANRGVVLSSGVEGGGYWNAGSRLKDVAENEVGFSVENAPSEGSLDNLEKLLDPDSPVNVAFAQADAVQYYLNSKNHNDVHKLELIENVGEECVFVVTGRNSDIEDADDLEDAKDLRLGIASSDSGVAVTFDYMASQMTGLLDIRVRYGETEPLMSTLNTPQTQVDAVMTVHRPRELSPEVEYALARPDSFRFVTLDVDRLPQELWDGRRIYRSMKLAMPGASEPVETICVLGVLLGNKQKLTLEQRNQLSEVADYHWMKVYVTE